MNQNMALDVSSSGIRLSDRRTPWFHLWRLAPIFVLAAAAILGLGALWTRPVWAADPPIRYVAAAPLGSNAGGNTCVSIYRPCATIQYAIGRASSGDEIRVAAGYYTGTLSVNKSLTLRGGYTLTNWVQSWPEQHITIVDAQAVTGTQRVVELAGSVAVVVDGFRLTGGHAHNQSGAGLYAAAGTLTVLNSHIYGNHVTGATADGGGLGIESNASLVLRRSRVYGNTSQHYGGGLLVNQPSGSVLIESAMIYQNTAADAGGGMIILDGEVTVRSSLIYANASTGGDYGGGGIAIGTGQLGLENNTFYGNSTSKDGGGIWSGTNAISITNCLIVGNTAGSTNGGLHTTAANLSYTDFWSNTPGHGYVTGTGNRTDQNPQFVNAAGYDLRLTAASPARDSGTALSGVTMDWQGEGRPFGAALDRGGDEYTDLSSGCLARVENGRVYTDVQPAIQAAAGGVVQVAGHCVGTWQITQTLVLRGGYTATNWLNPYFGPTVLDANSSGRVLYMAGTATISPILENLHLTGGLVGGGQNGGGVYVGGNVNAALRNVVIYDNAAGGLGGGVYCAGSSNVELMHNTLYSNTASSGGGLYVAAGGAAILRNSILAGNTGYGVYAQSGATYTAGYNNLYGNSPAACGGDATVQSSDVSVMPGFVDAGGGNFHLVFASSQAINAADPASPLAGDFDGQKRPLGRRADMGADESLFYPDVDLSEALAPTTSPYVVTDVDAVRGKPITFTHTVAQLGYTPSHSDTVQISWSNSAGWTVSLAGITPTTRLDDGSSRTFQVVVWVPLTVTAPFYNQTWITATVRDHALVWDRTEDIVATPGIEFSPSYTRNIDPGQMTIYTHTLRNSGLMTDTFNVTAAPSTLGWMQSVSPTGHITLPGGSSIQVVARVLVPATAPASLADVLLIRAASLNYPVITAVVTDTTIANPTVGDRYVAPSGSNINNNCTQKAQPCRTVGHAVNQTAWSDDVLVVQGTYQEGTEIFIKTETTLRGGYNIAFSSRNPDPASTTIDAMNTGRTLNISVPPAARVVVEGITLKNGFSSGAGGAVYIKDSQWVTLTQVIILNSTATQGGGVYVQNSSPILENVVISHTQATVGGGGVYVSSGSPRLDSCVIARSSAPNGGGVYNQNGSLTLWNTFIYSNTATAGGGGVYNRGTLHSLNNTLYGNRAGTVGGGIFDSNSVALNVRNTIIAGGSATSGGGLYREGSSALSVDYNDVWGNTATVFPDSNISTGAHSISANPMFLDPGRGDLRLPFDSPCVDVGDPATALTYDFEDDLRPTNQGFDIGADEVAGCLARVVTAGGVQVGPIYGVLQQAIDAASNGQTVQISGVCRGAQGRDGLWQAAIVLSKTLTLAGGYSSNFATLNPGAYPTVLNALGQGRGVVISGTAAVTISNLTVSGGDAAGLGGGPGGADVGGGVYVTGTSSRLVMVGCVISDNLAALGGGLYQAAGAVTLGGDTAAKRTWLVGNNANDGGGIYLAGGALKTGLSTLLQNEAGRGGGIYLAGGAAVISQTQLYSNTALSGGGAYNDGGGSLLLERSVVLYNAATQDGGGVYNLGDLRLFNTLVVSNTAGSGSGGGLYNTSALLTVRHDTFYANHAGNRGGGIYHNAASTVPIINNTIVVSNTAGQGGGVYSAGSAPQFNYNDVWRNNTVGVSGAGNISADPRFISFLPTHVQFLHVPGGSPVEDVGDPASPLIEDIDGEPRPSNRGFDIGADEVGGCYVRVNGLTPTYGNIQVAVSKAQNGDQLWIAGTCQGVNPVFDPGAGQMVNQTVFLTESLVLRGGYTVTNWALAPDPVLRPTVLDALGLGRVVYVTGTAQISITGLHLRQGAVGGNGGAVFVGSGVMTMTLNRVYSSTATNGGALYNRAGQVYLFHNKEIRGNQATNGGAIYNAGGQITVDSNDIRDNRATTGGAFYHGGGVSVVQNNVMRQNQATGNGGAIYSGATGLTAWHNTLYANSAANGGGFYTTRSDQILVNTILLNNTASSAGAAIYGPAGWRPDYNDVYPLPANAYGGGATAGAHSLAVDPLLVNPTGGDFHLSVTWPNISPLIDRGGPAVTLKHDMDGDLRPADQGFDIGADERQSCWARVVRGGVQVGDVYASIQLAANVSQPGDEIQVTVGECWGVHPMWDGSRTVSQTVHITHSLYLRGGFRRDFASQYPGPAVYPDAYATALFPTRTGNAGRALWAASGISLRMDRFILIGGSATGMGGGPGSADAGGAMYDNGTRSTLYHVDFYSSTAAYGGAVYHVSGAMTMTNSWINFNTATADGGAVYNATGMITITGESAAHEFTRLYQNTAVRGGAVFNASGEVRLIGNHIEQDPWAQIARNQATQGGVVFNQSGTVYLEHNTIFENTAQQGGVLYNNGTARLDLGNRLYDNTAELGGAIYYNGGSLTLWNTLLLGNAATQRGGGLYLVGGSPAVLHNNFYQNSAVTQGGGVYIQSGSPNIRNNIFDGNTAPVGSGSAIYAAAAGAAVDYNDFWPQAASFQVAGLTFGSNNLNADPLYRNLAVGDFHLQDLSPLVDAGQEQGVPHDWEENIRPSNLHPDIGADEVDSCMAYLVRTATIYGSIQQAIDDAQDGDQIRVAAGVCYENLVIAKSLIIVGSYEKNFQRSYDVVTTTIDGRSLGRVVHISGNVNVELDRFKLVNGRTTGDGGAVWSSADHLTMIEVIARGNSAVNGGGIYLAGGTVLLDIGEVDYNQASGDGGGIYNAAGVSVTLRAVGMYANEATGNGGGLYNAPGSYVLVTGGSSIGANEAVNGGGIYNNGATLIMINKRLVSNNATTGNGGGIYATNGSSLDLTNVALMFNMALQGSGGGIYRNDVAGSATLWHNTIRLNYASTSSGSGGGVYNGGSPMSIYASIVAYNMALSGSGIYGGSQINLDYVMRFNNVYSGAYSDQHGLNANPWFFSSSSSDLYYTSPAIDAVPPLFSAVVFDHANDPRMTGAYARAGYTWICAKDMGFDEYIVMPQVGASGPSPVQSTLPPSQAVTYTFYLRNSSEHYSHINSADTNEIWHQEPGYTQTVAITLQSTYAGWARIVGLSSNAVNPLVYTRTASFDVAPSQVVTVLVRVEPPVGVLAGMVDQTSVQYSAWVWQRPGLPEPCSHNLTVSGSTSAARTTVAPVQEFEIAPDRFGAALPGQTVTYTHRLTNTGNMTDTFLIYPKSGFYGTGLIVSPTVSSVALGPGQSCSIIIQVTVADWAAGGLIDVSGVVVRNSVNTQKAVADNTSVLYTSGVRHVSLVGQDSLVDETAGSTDPEAVDLKDNNCLSPQDGACRTIQQAIDQAAPGDLIKIDQGVYHDVITRTYQSQVITQTALVNESVILRGGYDRNDWGQDPPNHISQTTTLDPQGLGRVFYVAQGVTVTVDRLTLVGGNAGQGGAIYNQGANLTLTANRLTGHTANDGGVVYQQAGRLLLWNNMLHDNQALADGGAVYVLDGVTVIQNNTFFRNQASGAGGAIYVTAGNLTVQNNIVVTHTATDAAVYGSPAAAWLDYNVYYNNSSGHVGGTLTLGTHDMLADPAFVDPTANPPNLHIESGSAARDRGMTVAGLTLDYDNDPRPLGLRYDIGADERIPIQRVLFYPDVFTSTLPGQMVVITHTLVNDSDITDTITLTAVSNLGWTMVVTPQLGVPFSMTTGEHRVVTVTYQAPPTSGGQTQIAVITATSTGAFDWVQDSIKVRAPEWQIAKLVQPADSVRPGGRLTYTLIITNVGDLATAGPYTITDVLPTYTHLVVAVPPATFSPPVVRWTSTDVVTPGGSFSLTLVVTVTRPLTDGTPIVNRTYGITGGLAYTAAWGLPVTVTAHALADVSVIKVATSSSDPTGATVRPGEWITYTITVANAASADGPALNVRIRDTLPNNIVLQSATAPVVQAGRLLTWTLADPLAVGSSRLVTAVVRVTSPLITGTQLVNTALAAASNIPSPVTHTVTTTVRSTNSIAITKTVHPLLVASGGAVTYTITLTNSGDGIAHVSLTDVLGAGFNPPSYTTVMDVPGHGWNTAVGTATVSFAATAPLTGGLYYNRWVTATYDAVQTVISQVAPLKVEQPILGLTLTNDSPTMLGAATVLTGGIGGGSDVLYQLSLGDGSLLLSGSMLPGAWLTWTHTYPAAGVYTAIITVSNGVSQITATTLITVDELITGLQAINNSPTELGSLTHLTATVTAGSHVVYAWWLGDGAVGSGSTLSHTYPAIGVYTAVVTASNSVSQITATTRVTVTDVPIAGLVAINNSPTPLGYLTTLTATIAAGSNVSYTWSFGDGGTAYSATAWHAYPAVGIYTATVTATNSANTLWATTRVTITDPLIGWDRAVYTATESQGVVVLTVTLSAPTSVTVTVDWIAEDNTAIGGADYALAGGTLTLRPGQTMALAALTLYDDLAFEPNETLTVTLREPLHAALGAISAAQVVIVDDDPIPMVGFSATSYTVQETAGYAIITVTLSNPSSQIVTVDYATSDGSATAGSDYMAVSGTLTWMPGTVVQTFTVSILDDATYDPNESLNLTLSNAVNALIQRPDQVTLFIVDDEPPPVYIVYLPLVMRSYSPQIGRDLVVEAIRMVSTNPLVVEVTIRNLGAVSVPYAFWVDLYVDPNPVPTSVNQLWDPPRCIYGGAWFVTAEVPAGGALTLSTAHFEPSYSNWPTVLSGSHVLYAQVDAYGADTGLINEDNEGNNIYGPVPLP